MMAGKTRTTDGPARRVSFSELLGGQEDGVSMPIVNLVSLPAG